MKLTRYASLAAVLFASLIASASAMAHIGHTGNHSAFVEGLLHPLSGLDHLAMGLGLGLLMARTLRLTRLRGFAILIGTLTGGFAMGVAGMLPTGLTELGISLSLIVLASALWARTKSVLLLAVASLGLFHGVAHGADVPAGLNPADFLVGMLITLAALYTAGMMASLWLQRRAAQHGKKVERIAAVLTGSVVFLA